MRSLFALGIVVSFGLAASCGGEPLETGNNGGSKTGTGGSSAGTNPAGGKGGTGQATCEMSGLKTCTTLTGNVCANITNDRLNCGACGTMCANSQVCTGSQCACTGGLKACGSACVNSTSDPMNCGTCGTICSGATPFCSQSVCSATCMGGTMACGNSCADLLNDPFNCGSCMNTCAGGQACTNGACGCPPGQSTCNGICVDLRQDTMNCGTCGTRCVVGQVCANSSCTVSGAGGSGGSGGAGGSGGSGVSGAGGSTGGSGGTGVTTPERMGCEITPGLIADFEEVGAEPVVVQHEDRTGEWETYNDGTSTSQTAVVEPSGGTEMCDKSALHVKGSGYSEWGAGFGFSLVGAPTMPSPYNATAHNFTGIRFKAKLGSTADMNSPVRLNFSTPWTESAENPGGLCMPSAATTTKAAMDCYQHAGRFLPMGTGAGQLSTTFQTFTYCFDRDLYPLSIPSNLTTEQRNSIGTNLLKVQFQFNSGKDYRGAYPAMGEYPEFSKALPFDFWLDDVEFITGDCPNMPASPSNGSPAKPFPQNSNIGSCMPATNAAKFAGNLIEAYQHWTRTFVMDNKIVAPEQQNAVTSEAMGYGMMIAAAMGDKAAFDKFWGYVQTRMSGGLMIWKEGSSGSATDGDIDLAYALLMGHAQWPSGGYKAASDSMAAALLNQTSGDVANNVLRGGNTFRDSNFNPSYFIPAALAKFAGASMVLSTNYGFVNTNVTSGTSGVPTDWGSPNDGRASGPGSAQVTSDITDGENGAMGYDAARVPWRLGQHACQDSSANKTALMAISSFFAQKYDNGATIDLMKAGWLKTNGNPHTNAKDSQGSFIGPMGVAGMATGNTAMRDRAFRAMLDILENGDFNHTYFPSTVGLITALIMSGNFPVP